MMTDTFGPTSPTPFAYYDPDTCSVRTSQATFPWDSTPSSPTLPPWGMTRGGELFARPTPAPLTAARDSSSLPPEAMLQTPRVSMVGSAGDLNNPKVTTRLEGQVALLSTPVSDNSRGLPSKGTDYQSLPNVAVSMLPTPTSRDHKGRNQRDDSTCLPGAVQLLPTPTVQQGRNATSGRSNPDSQHYDGWTLNDLVFDGTLTSAPTPQPSPDGNTSPDATLPLPLNLDGTTDPD